MKKNLIQEKSFQFSLMIIELYQKLQEDKEFILSKQTIRSGTSIGANVEEAIAAFTKREFNSKMSISLKEARETRYWLRLLKVSSLTSINVDKELQEIEEIINLLYRIVKTTRMKLLAKSSLVAGMAVYCFIQVLLH